MPDPVAIRVPHFVDKPSKLQYRIVAKRFGLVLSAGLCTLAMILLFYAQRTADWRRLYLGIEAGRTGISMVAIVSLLVIAMVSLLAVRAGSTALMMTGLSWDAASFQSYSAFFGVGFTTREAELVVNHPVRRRIIRDLILAGNIGITSAAATLVATMVQNSNGYRPLLIVGGLILGLGLLLYLTRVSWIQRTIDKMIQHTLERTGLVRVMDYELLLRIQHGYVVSEMEILADSKIANQSLRQSRPWDHGVVILSVKSGGKDRPGIPNADTILLVGDVVTVYGEEHHIRKIFDSDLSVPAVINEK